MTTLRRVTSVMLLLGSMSGCLGGDSVTSCSPSYNDEGPDGYVGFRQLGPGLQVEWGAYLYNQFNHENGYWDVKVYSDGRQVDRKLQHYPPHGRVNQVDVRPGKLLRVTGTVSAGESMNKYSFTGIINGLCKMA